MGKRESQFGASIDERTRLRSPSDSHVAPETTKVCPISLANPQYPRAACVGSRCALWNEDKSLERIGQGLGRCGLGGGLFKDPNG